MSGDAHDPVPAARPDHDPVLIWNGLVTRIRRSVGERRDGNLAAAKTRPAELPDIGTRNHPGTEPTPIDPDLS
jgi:hypothetical protein